jgi:flavin-dependent dehydrogenase
VQPDGGRSQPFYFSTRYDKDTIAQSWQVLRSEFDQMMLDNARQKGADVREEIKVTRLLWEGDRVVGVAATDAAGCAHEFRAPITLDCTGKEATALVGAIAGAKMETSGTAMGRSLKSASSIKSTWVMWKESRMKS